MKILLIQPPNKCEIPMGYTRDYSKKARSTLPPLGLLYLASYLKTQHDVKVIDMMLSGQDVDDLPAILASFKPDLVGVPGVIGLWPGVVEVFRAIKHYDPAIYTVAGGPNATQYPEETLSLPEIDFVVVGIGQKPLMLLCEQLENGESGEGIENCYVKGVSYAHYRTIYSKEHELDNFPFPERFATPFTQYHVKFCPENPTTTMVTSMGCPFHCAFCPTTRPRVQIRSVKTVVDEMREIQSMGIRSILFQDELFTLKPNRVREICEGLIEREINLHWNVKSRIDCIKPWMPELMKKAGCFNIHFGIESGNDETLQRMNKGYTAAQVRNTVRMVKESGLSCSGNFMLAYPGESERDVRQTIDFSHELDLNVTQFSITLDPPGSKLFAESQKARQQNTDPWSEFTRDPDRLELVEHFASDRLPPEKLFELLNEALSSTRTLFDINKNNA